MAPARYEHRPFEVKYREYDADFDIEEEIFSFDALAMNFMLYTGCAAEDVDEVIVEITGGRLKASADGCR